MAEDESHLADRHETACTAESLRNVTAVVLAGGLSRRMQGQDKGLMELNGKLMIRHVLDALSGQVSDILINANRNIECYQALGHAVVQDQTTDYRGPLAGIACALPHIDTELLLCVPCDAPLIARPLARRLADTLYTSPCDIAVAHDGNRLQPVFCMLRKTVQDSLQNYLQRGGRKIDTWFSMIGYRTADFSDCPDMFVNINRPQDHALAESHL